MMNQTETSKEIIEESIDIPTENKKEYILDSFGTISNNGEPTTGLKITDDDEIMGATKGV